MCEINKYILIYKLIQSFNSDILIKNLILPIYKDDLFTFCFSILQEKEISQLLNTPVKTLNHDLLKEDFLFYLNEIEVKEKLYSLSISSLFEEHKSINNFIYSLLTYANNTGASDIHFDVNEQFFYIRFRIDGRLKHYFNFDKKLFLIVSSVLKLYCKEDITQLRKPLNGRFTKSINNKEVDFRFSSMPTIFGESLVLRILNKANISKNLKELGFSTQSHDLIKKSLTLSSGIILVTGPTGSGKTTSLYAMLNILKNLNKKIITIEDPVEYRLDYIQQVEINEKINLTYHEILKNILRQDPDIILIGEIRDEEALNIAIQASLTGHLVLATLHTNSACDTLNRLKDLNAPSYLLANTLKTIVSQRLVLKKCERCFGKGCASCNYTKYKNREVISETLYINEEIAAFLLNNKDSSFIKKYLHSKGFVFMEEDANNKIKNNKTTLTEVNNVLNQEL